MQSGMIRIVECIHIMMLVEADRVVNHKLAHDHVSVEVYLASDAIKGKHRLHLLYLHDNDS